MTACPSCNYPAGLHNADCPHRQPTRVVLTPGDALDVTVIHRDASTSHVKIDVDDHGSWGLVIDPEPSVPYSLIEPETAED